MTEQKTRAQKMVAEYAEKLKKLEPTKIEPRKIKMAEEQTLDQKERLRKAKEKLRDFIDLIH